MNIEILYPNRSAILYASGPSLTEKVVEKIHPHKHRFIHFGCNNTFDIVPFLDVHYACDTKWWRMYNGEVKQKIPYIKSYTQCSESAEEYNLNFIKGKHLAGLSTKEDLIHYGGNSGYQQLNLAFLMGVSQVFLVGYDMGFRSGKSHYFGNYPAPLQINSPYKLFIEKYREIQPVFQDRITNCTLGSSVTNFRFCNLEDVLESSNI